MKCVKVPYDDYVKGISAITTLDAIKKMVEIREFCTDDIRVLLNVELKEKIYG